MNFHPAVGTFGGFESELSIEFVSIAGCQHPAAQTLQIRMCNNGLHQPFANSLSAISLKNKHICKISKSRQVGNHSGKPDLLPGIVHAKAQTVGDSLLDCI